MAATDMFDDAGSPPCPKRKMTLFVGYGYPPVGMRLYLVLIYRCGEYRHRWPSRPATRTSQASAIAQKGKAYLTLCEH